MSIIALIDKYLEDLMEERNNFIDDLNQFPNFEKQVRRLSNELASGILSLTLSEADELIRNSGLRKDGYSIQRKDDRSLISSVGDFHFQHTLFKDKATGRYHYLLDELMSLPDKERLTSEAEAIMLNEAEAHSYQHAAEAISVGSQKVSRTTVMNKVHAVEDEFPEPIFEQETEKKHCRFLYLEADEDHIHRQQDGKIAGCMVGKLIYLFEGKEDVCKGKRTLVHPFYFAGLYQGSEMNQKLWDKVQQYIDEHYDTDYLETVYLTSDGGAWIQTGVDTLYKCKPVIDRFHMTKYINRASRLTGDKDKENDYKQRFYKYIYKDKLLAAKKLLGRIRSMNFGNANAEDFLDQCLSYFENNWDAIQRAYRDKNTLGSSTEGHVSNVLSDRMSSRPMGWSETGSDRMCKLRCFIRNHGRDKVVDLVRYRRELACQQYAATGTDGMIDPIQRKQYSKKQREDYVYIERMHATLESGSTVRKILAIREQLGGI